MGKQLQSNETIGKAFSDVADSLEKAKLPERFDNPADALSRFATVENKDRKCQPRRRKNASVAENAAKIKDPQIRHPMTL